MALREAQEAFDAKQEELDAAAARLAEESAALNQQQTRFREKQRALEESFAAKQQDVDDRERALASEKTGIEQAARNAKALKQDLEQQRAQLQADQEEVEREQQRLEHQRAQLVELQARFDETNNIVFARTMESYGIHVAYGLPGLKTHAKIALVVRRDADGIRRYVHIGTGNYNNKTARTYTDLGLLTCNPDIGADLSDLFNSLTGVARKRKFRKLLVAPGNLRKRTLELIEREAAHARAGANAHINAKMNALVDAEVIGALYEASQAGVEIELIVRGICCLVPGLPGFSDRIRVVSIIGRFLEHSRIFHLANNGSPEYYIGSADWMRRNLSNRVEAITPIEDPRLQEQLAHLLQASLQDERQAWEMLSDGRYQQRRPRPDDTSSPGALGTHIWLMRHARHTAAQVGEDE